MRVENVARFLNRYVGLIGKATLGPGKALYIDKCRRVHTWFMRFAIDVVFVDDNGVVVEIIENLQPWRVTQVIWGAEGCIELSAGQAAQLKICRGQKCLIDNY